MAKDRQFWAKETLRSRATVDALREVMGMDPLYNQKAVPQESWLSNLHDAYYDQRPTRTAPKSGTTGSRR